MPELVAQKKSPVFWSCSLLLGWLYVWTFPRAFPKKTTFGFGYGMLHGALMPLALPSLLMGQDVEIFATDNSGRIYKIGYICGINLCGLSFFGPLFWRPRRNLVGQKNHRAVNVADVQGAAGGQQATWFQEKSL